MTPEESDVAAAIAETPADAVYRGKAFQVTAPQPKRGQKLEGADIFDEPELSITALCRDFDTPPKPKTRIQVDGATYRITDVTTDSKKAGHVLSLQSINK